jgi:hypothetical protein
MNVMFTVVLKEFGSLEGLGQVYFCGINATVARKKPYLGHICRGISPRPVGPTKIFSKNGQR